jgi:hypothetical protein
MDIYFQSCLFTQLFDRGNFLANFLEQKNPYQNEQKNGSQKGL